MENIIYFAFSDSRQSFCGKFKIFCGIPGLLLFGCVVGAVPEAEKQENRVRRKLGQSCGMLPQVIYSTPCSLIKFYAVSRQIKLSHKLDAFLQQRKNLDGVALTEVELTEN